MLDFGLSALALLAIRFLTSASKNEARDEQSQAVNAYNRTQGELRRQALRMSTSMDALGVRRLSYLRVLAPRLSRDDDIALHRILDPDAQSPFELARAARRMLRRPPTIIDDSVTYASLGILAVQGLEALDRWKLVDVPVFNESLKGLAHNLHLSALEPIADELAHEGIVTVADALSGVAFIFSVFKIGWNLNKAAEAREDAERIQALTREADAKVQQTLAVKVRADALHEQLNEAGYQAFRDVWVVGELRRTRGLAGRRARGLIAAGRRSAERFWRCLNVRLLNEDGSPNLGSAPA